MMDEISNDLQLFLKFCKDNQMTNKEILQLCKPLDQVLKRKRGRFYLFCSFLSLLILITFIFYYFVNVDTISWHMSAVGRIILIELLPYWDWRHLKNSKCFVDNFMTTNVDYYSEAPLKCVLCEAIDKVDIKTEIESATLNDHYIELHKPIILTHSINNWPVLQNPHLFLKINDSAFLDSIPCKLSTNINNGPTTTKNILKKVKKFDKYFLHFQNCFFEAVKSFRSITPRPEFLPAEISPAQYNWLITSKNYNVTNYKLVELKEPIALIAQATGSNLFRLIPHEECEITCPMIKVQLFAGEVLIVTSLWNIEYKPYEKDENVAVILEMH